jgi:hypothetical protein
MPNPSKLFFQNKKRIKKKKISPENKISILAFDGKDVIEIELQQGPTTEKLFLLLLCNKYCNAWGKNISTDDNTISRCFINGLIDPFILNLWLFKKKPASK